MFPKYFFVFFWTLLSLLLASESYLSGRVTDSGQSSLPEGNSIEPWGDFIVPYVVSSNYSENERRILLSSLREISSRSCLRFKVRWSEVKYLDFVKDDGCQILPRSSTGQQKISFEGNPCLNYLSALTFVLRALGYSEDELEKFIYRGGPLQCGPNQISWTPETRY